MQSLTRILKEYSITSMLRVTLVHLSAFFVFWVGWSYTAIALFIVTYLIRLFAISGGYHRYFTHRSYKTSRFFQFILAVIGTTTGQKGPLSWATSHRHHHKYADTPLDPHSPIIHGWFHAHIGWLLKKNALPTSDEIIKEYKAFPEVIFLNQFHYICILVYMLCLYLLGSYLENAFPVLNTSGWQLLIWGGILSTLLLLHTTCFVSSIAHLIGDEDYKTNDSSKNTSWLYFLSLGGENWHNTHHKYPWSANMGIRKGQVDSIFYVLLLLKKMGIVWDLKNAEEQQN